MPKDTKPEELRETPVDPRLVELNIYDQAPLDFLVLSADRMAVRFPLCSLALSTPPLLLLSTITTTRTLTDTTTHLTFFDPRYWIQHIGQAYDARLGHR